MDQELDNVTRLPGRTALRDRLDIEVARAQRYGASLSLLLAEVEANLKVEDETLRHLAIFLLSNTRDEDFVSRSADHRFALILPDTDNAAALDMARGLIGGLAALDIVPEGTVHIGVATLGNALTSSDTLMAHTEEALRLSQHDSKLDVSQGVTTQRDA